MSTHTIEIYGVDGMTCAHCVRAVTTEVAAVPGVRDVEVDLAAGTVTIASEHALDPAAVHAAVEEAGYEIR